MWGSFWAAVPHLKPDQNVIFSSTGNLYHAIVNTQNSARSNVFLGNIALSAMHAGARTTHAQCKASWHVDVFGTYRYGARVRPLVVEWLRGSRCSGYSAMCTTNASRAF